MEVVLDLKAGREMSKIRSSVMGNVDGNTHLCVLANAI